MCASMPRMARFILAEPPGGLIGFLPVNGNVADASAVGFYEFFALHKHAARSAARVEHAALVGRDHFHQQLDDIAGV